jgi:hypothetical protein
MLLLLSSLLLFCNAAAAAAASGTKRYYHTVKHIKKNTSGKSVHAVAVRSSHLVLLLLLQLPATN